jgi:hypothetical protein
MAREQQYYRYASPLPALWIMAAPQAAQRATARRRRAFGYRPEFLWTGGAVRTMIFRCSADAGMTTMNVADWSRSLGLERYEPAFRENEIDDTVLRRLTAEVLNDFGVTLMGNRRRVLDAIAALNDAAPTGEPAETLVRAKHVACRAEKTSIGRSTPAVRYGPCDRVRRA